MTVLRAQARIFHSYFQKNDKILELDVYFPIIYPSLVSLCIHRRKLSSQKISNLVIYNKYTKNNLFLNMIEEWQQQIFYYLK